MTVCPALMSVQYYTSYKSDLEYSIMEIGQRRAVLSYESSLLAMSAASDPDVVLSDDPVYQAMSYQDKMYEQQQKTLETQLAEVTAMLESFQKLEENNIKNEFKLNLGSGN